MSSSSKSDASLLSVSVVLASHNGAAFIEAQLRSILSQSLLPLEVVLSDDASSDDTLVRAQQSFEFAVEEFGASEVALRVIRNPRPLGVTANFEFACAASVGGLIALCDQDDVWEPDRLAIFVAAFEAAPNLVLLHSDATLIDDEGTIVGRSLLSTIRLTGWEKRALMSGRAFDVLLRRNVVTGATTMFRRELLELARPFPPGWIHDEWLAIVAAATGELRLLDRRLTRYRQHSSNQIGAAALTVGQGMSRFTTARGIRNARLLEHARTAVIRLGDLGELVSAADKEKSAAKLRHEEFRSSLPAPRYARLIPIARALFHGQYRHYSRGTTDAIRDLIQAA